MFSNTYKEHWNNAMAGESPIPLSQSGNVLMMAVREGDGCRVIKGMVNNDLFGNQCRNQSTFNVLDNKLNTPGSKIHMPNGVPILLVRVPIHLVQRRTYRQQYFVMGMPPGDPDTDRFLPLPSPPRDRLAIENKCVHETNAPAMEEPRVTGEAKASATKQSAVDHVNALKDTVIMEKRHVKHKLGKKEEEQSEDETHVSEKIIDKVEQRQDRFEKRDKVEEGPDRLKKRKKWLAYQMKITPLPALYEGLYKCGAESLDTTIISKRGWDKTSRQWLERRSNAFADFVVWGEASPVS